METLGSQIRDHRARGGFSGVNYGPDPNSSEGILDSIMREERSTATHQLAMARMKGMTKRIESGKVGGSPSWDSDPGPTAYEVRH